MDAFWNRLSGTNDRLCEWEEVRQFAGPWEEPGSKLSASFKRRMYVYLELDSLEYAIAKYRIGYMTRTSPPMAAGVVPKDVPYLYLLAELPHEPLEAHHDQRVGVPLAVPVQDRYR